MSELCYKLNIPNFDKMVKDEWKHNLSWAKRREIPTVSWANSAIKEEYLNFNSIDWDTLVAFPLDPATNYNAHIHSDNYSDTIDESLANPKIILFGINFVINGSGRMDYYLPSQLDKTYFVEPNYEYPQRNWTTTQEPYKSYEMTPGAYLLNISVPHKATAHSNRLLFSLRPKLTPHNYFAYWQTKSWEDIVKLFENHIM